ncbi:hypothetical protein CP533_0365 [Ophiocordyceps camponoti-saundersi (nom. inval.)]|nr:hypothetical protein CP533_0365 [Ophiocordyceps camponoti-saundersi (nom. inval.)]
MSLIPYHPREGREIVLRHQNSVVVRDPDSRRLEIRRTECPTCHQPLGRASSPERAQYDRSRDYVDPGYFLMLRDYETSMTQTGAPSPVRRLFPALASDGAAASAHPVLVPPAGSFGDEAEFVSSAPGVGQVEGSRIRKEAFSSNYFKTFFVEETVLGRGGKGVVLLVRHEIDGCQLGYFACKRVPVGDDHAWLEKVLVEVELLAKLSHPNLVSYRHVWLEDVQLNRFGPSVACAFILQQYCNSGDLHQYVVGGAPREATKEELKAQMRRRSKGQAEPPRSLAQLSFDDIYTFFKDITSGVAYLHASNYIHRDLKPSNCLLHGEGGKMKCLISDFGEVQPENMARKSTGSTGTISYCAPEVLKMDAAGRYGNFTTKSDMFSLGMILYFMCFGRLPYQGANAIQEELEDIEQLRTEIVDWKGFQDERRQRPDLPPRLYKLLKRLLALDPAERPSANEVLTAMRSGINFDGIPSPASAAGRVQNLDSPAPPGTPASGEMLSDVLLQLIHAYQVLADARDERAWDRFASHVEPGHYWPRSDAPDATPSLKRDAVAQSGVSQRRGHSLTPLGHGHVAASRPASSSGETFSPPLLMAPPRTRGAELRYQLQMAAHRLVTVFGVGEGMIGYIARLGFFLLKLGSLARPCWPLAASPQVSIPLVVVAALDLGLSSGSPFTRRRRRRVVAGLSLQLSLFPTSLVLLAFHFIVLWLARRWSTLCVSAPSEDWNQW